MRSPAALYLSFLLKRPTVVVVGLSLLLAFFAFHARNFRLDASAESLLLEDDRDLQLMREVAARYPGTDFLMVTYTPPTDLFADETLEHLKRLRDAIRGLSGVESVVTILDVPLVVSADLPIAQLAQGVPTLEDESVSRSRAREELSTSPVYRDLVLSRDFRTTALLVNLKTDEEYTALLGERNELLIKRGAFGLAPEEEARFERVSARYDVARAGLAARRHAEIAELRSVIADYRDGASLHLGGVSMIADDMVTFVRRDLVVFGSGVLVLIFVLLGVIFRSVRWVLLPLLSCFYAGTSMVGLLGLVGWEVTVISSNFMALMLIITLSMNVHLVVRYLQLQQEGPDETQQTLVGDTLRKMVSPCFYTALTTILGFCSLVVSDIKPVIDFGWMMSIGLAVAFLTSFSLFPAVLLLMGKPRRTDWREGWSRVTAALARFTERHSRPVLWAAVVMALVSVAGISRLTVENSFIDYFSEDTEIYQGMKLIDEKLGGTTTLEVLLHLDPGGVEEADEELYAEEDEDEYFDDWDVDVAAEPAYWFTPLKIERIKKVHDYLDGLPEVGKVLSLASGIRVAELINDGEELDGLELSVLYKKLPDQLREPLIDPYVSIGHNEARIFVRIVDSQEGLRRQELLQKIRTGLGELELGESDVTVTGALVLYNNMLQSLFRSQISSLVVVIAGITIMFMLLFRSVPIALIGIVPNLLAAGGVLGLMGLLGIPLDIMTITIAAITIGIAVDNAIHYIYRFREEYAQNGDYVESMRICHGTVGRAILYTSTTIICGFSILTLSNFYPTIYFGLLTGLAMFLALLAALTLVPGLLLLWRPLR